MLEFLSCSSPLHRGPPSGGDRIGTGGTVGEVGGDVGTGGAVSNGGIPGYSGAAGIAGTTEVRGTWIDRTAGTTAGGLSWTDVAADSTGMRLVAVSRQSLPFAQGDIWTSTDAGATWTNRTTGTEASGQGWASVASDSTGTRLVAVTILTGDIQTVVDADPPIVIVTPGPATVWTSSNAGLTWTSRMPVISTSPDVLEPRVASDATGSRLILAAGDIWTSTDGGDTWIDQTAGSSVASQPWVDIACDSTGVHVVAISTDSNIWTSSNGGQTWTNRTTGTAASGHSWHAVASDSTGTHLVAVDEPLMSPSGDIWVSTDAGATWTNRTGGATASGNRWFAVASDATGTHLIAASEGPAPRSGSGSAGDIWTSADSGMTWTNETVGTAGSGQFWAAVASDGTGRHLLGVTSQKAAVGVGFGPPCCYGGDIWTN